MGILHEDQCTFLIISCSVFLRMRNVADKTCRKNQNTRCMFSNPPPPSFYLSWLLPCIIYTRCHLLFILSLLHVYYSVLHDLTDVSLYVF